MSEETETPVSAEQPATVSAVETPQVSPVEVPPVSVPETPFVGLSAETEAEIEADAKIIAAKHESPTFFSMSDVDTLVGYRAAELESQIRGRFTEQLEQSASLISTLQAQNEELLKQLQAQAAQRKESDAARRLAERDGKLKEAISQTRCIDPTAGLRFVIADLVQDTEGDWLIRDGETLRPITAETVGKALPDSLKSSAVRGTGSGSASTRSGRSVEPSDLEKLQTEEMRLKQRYDKSRGSDTTALIELDKLRHRKKQLFVDVNKKKPRR